LATVVVRWRLRAVALAGFLLVLAFAPALRVDAARPSAPDSVYVQHACTLVLDAPSASARPLTQLPGGSELTLVGQQRAADGSVWDHGKMWSGLDAFVAAGDVGPTPPGQAEEGICAFPNLPDALAEPLAPAAGPWPLAARGTVSVPSHLLNEADDAALVVASAALGRNVTITAWTADPTGRPWYQVDAGGGATGWLPATSVRIDQPDTATARVGGAPIWQPIAGKGMWFTNYLPHHSDIAAIVQAARLAGLTHLYAEVAISRFGFYGRGTLDRLLPVAHAAGLTVIAWVYPNLDDVATDVRLTQDVASYITPGGEHVDGIATDVEEVTDSAAVYAYGQTVRALLSPNFLMVAAVLHPLTHPSYPYDAIAASWNVLAPMDYWHSRYQHPYAPADAQRFVATSIATIRAAVGPALPIEELGQAYDMYTDDGTGGGDAPSSDEIRADLQVARQLGCIGASYFDWQTMTQAEWQVLTGATW
jgi:hypothetical protein